MFTKKILAAMLCAALLCTCALTGCKKDEPATTAPTVSAEEVINTVALTVGDRQISAVELNYYYIEMINSFVNEYSYYLSALLNVSAPLNTQFFNEETNQTWSDYFLECSINDLKGTYALCDAAAAAGMTLTESDIAAVDDLMETIEYYATYYEFDSADAYLADLFGPGADSASYRAYYERNLLADNYYDAYYESLRYDDTTLREFEGENGRKYNSYSYATYFLSTTKYLTGGTEDADGNITYSDAERKAAEAACQAAAQAVADGSYADTEAFNTALKAIPANLDLGSVCCTEYDDVLYSKVSSLFVEWVSDPERKDGDLTLIPKTSGSEGNEQIDGYYIVMHVSTNDNTFFLKNVRHILVIPDGGTYNSVTGYYDYTDTEMSLAKVEAEVLLDLWQSGKRSEASFALIANEKSDDLGGNVTNGGLYENIFPGQMADEFNDWCYDENRKPGDCEIIGSDFGYHIMYFCGDSDFTYRDFMITSEKRAQDAKAWYDTMVEKVTVTTHDLQYVDLDLVLYG